jgi:hypothetical protein
LCTICEAGSYESNEGSESCALCPAGTASSVQGATEKSFCTTCSAGTYSSEGSSICSSCSTGEFSPEGSSNCSTSCPAGEGVLSDSSSASPSAQQCGSCNAGYYNDGTSIDCAPCPTNTVSGSGASSCRGSCPAGEGVLLDESSFSTSVYDCGACQPGYYNNGTLLTCIACAIRMVADSAGASACVACNSSTSFANLLSAATKCVDSCPAGLGIYSSGYSSMSKSEDACGMCQPGYYQQGISSTCSMCTEYQKTNGAGSAGYSTCNYPMQSFWFDWQTNSGAYYPCHAVSVGLPLEIGEIVVALMGLIALAFFSQIKDEQGRWDRKNTLVLLVYCLLPIMDYLTDLLYLLTSQFYNFGTFAASLMSILLPSLVFARRLWLRGVRGKFWVWEIPSSIWFGEYDNFYKIMVTSAIISPYLLVNSFVLVPLILLGVFLNGTKVISIGRVSNIWYYCLTGKSDYSTTQIIDTQVLNEAIYTHIVCETFFQIIAQVVNNTFMNRWTVLAYVSISFSALNTLNGLYQITYYKLHRKINLVDLPFSLTLGGLLPEDYQIRSTVDSKIVGATSRIDFINPILTSVLRNEDKVTKSGDIPKSGDPESVYLLRDELKHVSEQLRVQERNVQRLENSVRILENAVQDLSRSSIVSHSTAFGIVSVMEEL